MQAISALAFIPFESYRRTKPLFTKILKAYNSLVMQVPDMGLCMHVRHINELYACQVSDGYLVKQASSSGSNFSRF